MALHFILHPWQLSLVILAGWVNRQQQEVIDYLRTENQVLKEKLSPGRILLTDDQRRRLAVKAKVLGRKLLEEIGTLVILLTRRPLAPHARGQEMGLQPVPKICCRPAALETAEILRFGLAPGPENPGWGYDRIQGALANLGHGISEMPWPTSSKRIDISRPPTPSGTRLGRAF